MGEFPHLEGRLRISGLEYIVDIKDVLEANLKDKKFLTPKTYAIIGVGVISLGVLIFILVRKYAPQKLSSTTTTVAPASSGTSTTRSMTTVAPTSTTTVVRTSTTTVAPTYNYIVYYFQSTGYSSGGYNTVPNTPQLPVTAMSSADLTGPDSLGNTYTFTGKSGLLTTSTPVTNSTTARALIDPPYELYAYNNASNWAGSQGRVATLSTAVNAAGIPKAVGLSYLGYTDSNAINDQTKVYAFQANYILQ